MKQKNINKFVFLTIILAILSCKKDQVIVPISGKVIDQSSLLPVDSCYVIINSTEELITDEEGRFYSAHDIGHFLVDSMNFYLSKPGYNDLDYNTIVGNTQKDLFLIEITPQ